MEESSFLSTTKKWWLDPKMEGAVTDAVNLPPRALSHKIYRPSPICKSDKTHRRHCGLVKDDDDV